MPADAIPLPILAGRVPIRAGRLGDVWPSRRERLMATICLGASISLAMVGMAAAAGRWAGVATYVPAQLVPRVLPRSLPYGKGMWIWQPEKTEGNDAQAMVTRSVDLGLTHLYVRTGSSWDGFYAGSFLDRILPVAHAAGIRVYGWDFPRLISTDDDVARAAAAVAYRTPDGHHIDGFAADIETADEGTHLSTEAAATYGDGLRQAVGPAVPLVAVVPRPSSHTADIGYPYAQVVARFDAVAPMVYWLNREPGTDVAGALTDLRGLGKPVFPVGQAYDGGPEGGRPGVPPPAELLQFFEVSYDHGAKGVSFWSWQEADQQAFDTIRDAPEFRANISGSGRTIRVTVAHRR
ncbi:MAG: hypothetical protein M3011_04310 [Actinomycetota bacterium]|nr:hypothetical protein [Actinomycetota bacterium]